jgi:protein-disulfide isomerase
MTDRDIPRLSLAVGDRDHLQGDRSAGVTLVEYGDYECPYCGQAYPIVKEVQERLGRSLRFVFRNCPLAELHPHAQHAAEVAEAAAAQGSFWQMHDALFDHQRSLDDGHLLQYAKSLELDHDKLESELRDHTYAGRVREDFGSGVRSGVNGTPTFFINGVRHDGAWDADSLVEALLRAQQVVAHDFL